MRSAYRSSDHLLPSVGLLLLAGAAGLEGSGHVVGVDAAAIWLGDSNGGRVHNTVVALVCEAAI